ncbi:isoaspartyl peptidase/L-asparaginase family protein [Candidatus Cryosericum septentrionale]|jgi:beta-aspartyl-peptidase (threonine type)|uniref:Isoaspartyl peptidase n=1 Tax=Candidatus Cryosericum septentrionale TaxID=2290913 RepID=A0A398DIW0_9BACT|nr:isoaspartyl peptidase/L-asparaginase family protein [Candidatus Cryosericum septentrionale]RIE15512.1 asparaginase [Candidatus Cryosericum septentrionale]
MYSIIVHGGVGAVSHDKEEAVIAGVRGAVKAGSDVLASSGSSLDAVETAIKILEDNPLFNCGTGSVLTFDGEVEMDAAVAYGPALGFGAIAGIKNIQHPISLARMVMEKTDHVLLQGSGAQEFARMMGIAPHNPITEERRVQWREYREKFLRGDAGDWPKLKALMKEHPEFMHGTVGAVAVDEKGEVTAGTSTGGVFLKLLGRVGDTPLPGAGTYATKFGGASSTGLGESMMRTLITKTACDFMRMGLDAQGASSGAVNMLSNILRTEAGIIVVDNQGGVGFAQNTPQMAHAYFKKGMSEPVAGL